MNQLWIDFLITAGVCSAVLAIRVLIKSFAEAPFPRISTKNSRIGNIKKSGRASALPLFY